MKQNLTSLTANLHLPTCSSPKNLVTLNFRPVYLQKLDTFKEGILLELVLNIYMCHLGQLEAKICPCNNIFLDPRFQRSKHGTTVTDHWSNKICRHWDSF